MKTLNAFGIAALIAASSTTAAFAGTYVSDDNAAAQTPFVLEEANPDVTRAQSNMEPAERINPFTVDDDDAASQTPFVYDDAK